MVFDSIAQQMQVKKSQGTKLKNALLYYASIFTPGEKIVHATKKPMLIFASIKNVTFIENIPALSIKFKDHKLMLPVSEHPYTYLIVNAYAFKVIHFHICYYSFDSLFHELQALYQIRFIILNKDV